MLRFQAGSSELPGSRFGNAPILPRTVFERIGVAGILSESVRGEACVQAVDAVNPSGGGGEPVTSDGVSDKSPTTA